MNDDGARPVWGLASTLSDSCLLITISAMMVSKTAAGNKTGSRGTTRQLQFTAKSRLGSCLCASIPPDY